MNGHHAAPGPKGAVGGDRLACRRRALVVAAVVCAVLVSGCSGSTEGKYGSELFESACAHCHGSDLGGGVGPPLGAGSEAAGLTDEQIVGVVRVGPGAMPAFGNRLDDAQVRSLIDYLREVQGA